MHVVLPHRWRRQPQYIVRPDWNHPLAIAAKLFAVVVPHAFHTLKGDGWMTRVGSGAWSATRDGSALAASGGTSDGWVTSRDFDELSGLTKLSTYFLGNEGTTTGVIAGRWGTSPNFGGFLVTWDSNEIATVVAQAGGMFYSRRTSGAAAGRVSYGVTWPGGASMTPYLNGSQSVGATWFTDATAAIQTVGFPLYINRHGDASTGSGASKVNLLVFGNEAWPDSIHREFHQNPWQIFRPIKRRIYVGEAVGGGGGTAVPVFRRHYQNLQMR